MSDLHEYHYRRVVGMCGLVAYALTEYPDEGNEGIVRHVMHASGGKANPNLVREIINEYRTPS